MAIAKIEKTGISVRNGKVQIRFSFYLEPSEAKYEEHHVQVPDLSHEVYPGKIDEFGNPVDMEDYNKWLDGLPKIWQNNPFHNHFIRVSSGTTDSEITKLMQDSLNEFYGIWSGDKDILKVWKAEPETPGDTSTENIEACELKALDIISRADSFREVA